MPDAATCWICGSDAREAYLFDGEDLGEVSSASVRITDSAYGRSAPLVRCSHCGFIYASPPPSDDVLSLYEDLEDPEYVAGASYRIFQMRQLLEQVCGPQRPGTLLDVGAGMGLLVEAAQELGIEATGVEPSRYLAQQGRDRGLDVLEGILPHPSLGGRQFDMVTCADVIEHVTDPVGLLRQLGTVTRPGGTIVVTTPDVESVAARAMGSRWWHYRVAHVCFFPTSAMEEAVQRAGLRIVRRRRQTWWFGLPYLLARTVALVGPRRIRDLRARVEARLDRTPLTRVTVPVNLFDSWVYECTHA